MNATVRRQLCVQSLVDFFKQRVTESQKEESFPFENSRAKMLARITEWSSFQFPSFPWDHFLIRKLGVKKREIQLGWRKMRRSGSGSKWGL